MNDLCSLDFCNKIEDCNTTDLDNYLQQELENGFSTSFYDGVNKTLVDGGPVPALSSDVEYISEFFEELTGSSGDGSEKTYLELTSVRVGPDESDLRLPSRLEYQIYPFDGSNYGVLCGEAMMNSGDDCPLPEFSSQFVSPAKDGIQPVSFCEENGLGNLDFVKGTSCSNFGYDFSGAWDRESSSAWKEPENDPFSNSTYLKSTPNLPVNESVTPTEHETTSHGFSECLNYENLNLSSFQLHETDNLQECMEAESSASSPVSFISATDEVSNDRETEFGENYWVREIKVGKNNRPRGPKCWEFVLRLLRDPSSNPSLVKWEDPSVGSFRLVEKDKISAIWGNRPSKKKSGRVIKYESFARILRYHYKRGKGMVLPVSEKHLVYKFGNKALADYRAGRVL